jgi:hypothetical protein
VLEHQSNHTTAGAPSASVAARADTFHRLFAAKTSAHAPIAQSWQLLLDATREEGPALLSAFLAKAQPQQLPEKKAQLEEAAVLCDAQGATALATLCVSAPARGFSQELVTQLLQKAAESAICDLLLKRSADLRPLVTPALLPILLERLQQQHEQQRVRALLSAIDQQRLPSSEIPASIRAFAAEAIELPAARELRALGATPPSDWPALAAGCRLRLSEDVQVRRLLIGTQEVPELIQIQALSSQTPAASLPIYLFRRLPPERLLDPKTRSIQYPLVVFTLGQELGVLPIELHADTGKGKIRPWVRSEADVPAALAPLLSDLHRPLTEILFPARPQQQLSPLQKFVVTYQATPAAQLAAPLSDYVAQHSRELRRLSDTQLQPLRTLIIKALLSDVSPAEMAAPSPNLEYFKASLARIEQRLSERFYSELTRLQQRDVLLALTHRLFERSVLKAPELQHQRARALVGWCIAQGYSLLDPAAQQIAESAKSLGPLHGSLHRLDRSIKLTSNFLSSALELWLGHLADYRDLQLTALQHATTPGLAYSLTRLASHRIDASQRIAEIQAWRGLAALEGCSSVNAQYRVHGMELPVDGPSGASSFDFLLEKRRANHESQFFLGEIKSSHADPYKLSLAELPRAQGQRARQEAVLRELQKDCPALVGRIELTVGPNYQTMEQPVWDSVSSQMIFEARVDALPRAALVHSHELPTENATSNALDSLSLFDTRLLDTQRQSNSTSAAAQLRALVENASFIPGDLRKLLPIR